MRPGRLSSIAYRHMSRDLLTTPARRIPAFSPRVLRALVFLSVAASIAGCAQQPTGRGGHSREYFPSSIYGAASERVVGEGEAVPRGGGQYLVGRPYTIAGKRYFPTAQPHESQIGMASYYGAAFHGRRTANGEVFDMSSISAAHPTMPLPSYARVTNLRNGRSIIVRVNDRGPYHGGRVMDVSSKVAEALDFKSMGTAQVRVDYVGRAGLEGSDDRKLLASLRTDGRPATLDGSPALAPTMLAENGSSAAPSPSAPVPQRLALAEPARLPEIQSSAMARSPAAANMPTNVPLPPSRPFDLGTIPGAGIPVSGPPLRPTAAMFYAAPQSPLVAQARAPFAKIPTANRSHDE